MSIRKLLEKPFGPYPEEVILSPTCASLTLETLRMERNGLPTGLDETEFVTSPPKPYSTSFYGVLQIKSLKWLTPEGLKILQNALTRRANNHRNVDLKKIYPHFMMSVWLHCVKNLPARFLTSNGYETDLVINSKRTGRKYAIASFDAGTFRQSRSFLTRYRLWVLIKEMIEMDPTDTPLEERNVEWLVDQYSRRLQKNSVDRFVRHVSRAEIRGMFAAHADWILAQHLASSALTVKKLNIRKWIEFCKDVQLARAEAQLVPASVGWGLPDGVTPNENILELSRFGVISRGWDRRIQNASKEKRAPTEKSRVSLPPRINSLSPATRPIAVAAEFIYDSDFSEPSTSSCSDSSADDLVLDIPATLAFWLRHPVIHDGQFEWQCPVCAYVIDLLHLKEEDRKALSHADVKILRNRRWDSLKNEAVHAMLLEIAKDHCTTLHGISEIEVLG